MRSPTGIPLFFLNLILLLLFSYIIADFCRIVNKVCVIFFDNSAKEQAGFRRSPRNFDEISIFSLHAAALYRANMLKSTCNSAKSMVK